jgi:DNA adenine methylase
MNSPFAYIGGKSRLSKQIITEIPAHKTYCEVFSGAAWVFFRKEPSAVEVINDLDSDLIAFYRVVQNHLEEFLRQFKWLLTSREWFEDWKNQLEARGLTDIQKAARYYYVQRQAFGGRVRSRTYGVQPDRRPRINLIRMEEEMSAVHLRLSQVWIESLSWKDLILRYDRSGAFFYCDPPYFECPDYKHNLVFEDYVSMAELLSKIKGKFMLSINDHPKMREVFKGFRMRPVSLLYSVSKDKSTKGKELLIRNY